MLPVLWKVLRLSQRRVQLELLNMHLTMLLDIIEVKYVLYTRQTSCKCLLYNIGVTTNITVVLVLSLTSGLYCTLYSIVVYYISTYHKLKGPCKRARYVVKSTRTFVTRMFTSSLRASSACPAFFASCNLIGQLSSFIILRFLRLFRLFFHLLLIFFFNYFNLFFYLILCTIFFIL